MWELPAPINRSGEIVSYDVVYVAHNETGSIIETELMREVLAPMTSTILEDLMEFTMYAIVVHARTSVGAGPSSMPIFVMTNESCKLKSKETPNYSH